MTTNLTTGQRVTTWTGDTGTVAYITRDGWVGVADDRNPARVDEWQVWQLTARE